MDIYNLVMDQIEREFEKHLNVVKPDQELDVMSHSQVLARVSEAVEKRLGIFKREWARQSKSKPNESKGKAPPKPPLETGYLRNCYVEKKEGDESIFKIIDGRVIAFLDGYRITPWDEEPTAAWIQAGQHYETRDGRIARVTDPNARSSDGSRAFVKGEILSKSGSWVAAAWSPKGSYLLGSGEHPKDLKEPFRFTGLEANPAPQTVQGKVFNCQMTCRPGDPPLFTLVDGKVIANLDGYHIAPIEDCVAPWIRVGGLYEIRNGSIARVVSIRRPTEPYFVVHGKILMPTGEWEPAAWTVEGAFSPTEPNHQYDLLKPKAI